MALKKKPVTGMKDILPKEMEIRNYVTGLIRETYGSFGFFSVEQSLLNLSPGCFHIKHDRKPLPWRFDTMLQSSTIRKIAKR